MNHTHSAFWENLYDIGDIGWDLSGPTKPFVEIFNNLDLLNKKVFVPGCGNGHDVIELAKKGAEVYAVDFVEAPLLNIKTNPDFIENKIHLIHSDIFEVSNNFNNQFDYVFEYTCYCAIDPKYREKYRDLVYRILNKKGTFISLFFPILKPEIDDGPPFGVDLDKTLEMFKDKFNILEINQSINSIPKRAGNEVLVFMSKNG